MKNKKGWIFFAIALVVVVLLIFFSQSANLGTKISLEGAENSIETLVGKRKLVSDDEVGSYPFVYTTDGKNYVYENNTKITVVRLGSNGIGYILKNGSKNSVNRITSSCDYYFNFFSDAEVEYVLGIIKDYNTYVDEYNAFATEENKKIVEENKTLEDGEKKPLYKLFNKIDFSGEYIGPSWWESLLPYLSVIIIVVMGIILIRSILGANSKSFTFGKTNAQVAHNVAVRFSDVAGIDEEKEELQEVVEFLKNPQKFTDLGAKIPKGILLVGLPGTGKTLLAKAIAGESNVPFFSISGSDFVEMFVGVGASRVRDLFEQAKREAPCIVFIDEIDAVGRQRGTGLGGGNDEREQTLNQLLVQMDGFEGNAGVIVIAATNRSDVLDPALMRPGRFDRQIYINPPDVKGREMILKIHARNKPIDKSVDFKNLARLTSGFTGADLENLLNESAILAARQNRKSITMTDITEGINKVIMGPQKKSRIITPNDKRITACHESGHAIIGKVLTHCDVVQEVSIIPRGMAAGYTISRPDSDEEHMSYNKLIDNITMMLGGRAAEALLIRDISTGASNDIERATKIARRMVTEWGMSSKLGPINLGSGSEVFLGRDYQTKLQYSEKTAAEIDSEVSNIVDSCYKKAQEILKAHIKEMDTMIEVLLEKETIYFNEIEMIMQGKSTKQVLLQMEKEEIRNKARIEIERAEADLEKTKKEQSIRIKTVEALKKGGIYTEQEIEKIKKEGEELIRQAEKKVQEVKLKNKVIIEEENKEKEENNSSKDLENNKEEEKENKKSSAKSKKSLAKNEDKIDNSEDKS